MLTVHTIRHTTLSYNICDLTIFPAQNLLRIMQRHLLHRDGADRGADEGWPCSNGTVAIIHRGMWMTIVPPDARIYLEWAAIVSRHEAAESEFWRAKSAVFALYSDIIFPQRMGNLHRLRLGPQRREEHSQRAMYRGVHSGKCKGSIIAASYIHIPGDYSCFMTGWVCDELRVSA